MNIKPPLTLVPIPPERYSDYRYEVIFKAYKWDPQVGDSNTIARHVLLLSQETAQELNLAAERLAAEVVAMEEALISRPDLYKALGFTGRIKKPLMSMGNYRREKNVRIMRFDFHPTDEGWKVSEVNSDVPAGWPECSILPKIAKSYFKDADSACFQYGEDVALHLLNSFQSKLKSGGNIAFIHATSYAEDRQLMQFLSDYFKQNGYRTFFAAPDLIRWEGKTPYSVAESGDKSGGNQVNGLVRYFPAEWLDSLPKGSNWQSYFNCEIPCCNHCAVVLSQSKRLPLVWDALGLDIPAWKSFLPETREPAAVPKGESGWIYKPAFGRVGDSITIKGTMPEKTRLKIEKTARREKRQWAAQRLFNSVPAEAPGGQRFHLCVGVFVVDGKAAGFYARMSETARIEEKAQDIAVFINKNN